MTGRAARSVVLVLPAAAAIGVIALACDDEHKRTPPGQVVGGGGACEAEPGKLPAADCDDSQGSCTPVPGCEIDEVRCGSRSTCLPLANNEGKDVVDLRFRRLNIAAPSALAGPFIQNAVINRGIELAEKSCAENGRGIFTWLMRVDKKAGTMTTGGAPPSSDPFGQGFCFASFDLNGTKIEPVTMKIEWNGGTFRSIERADINIPIFVSDELSSAIILPISDARIDDVTLSPDGNCVGAFNAAALDPSCAEDRALCSKWQTAGALGGFITLEHADTVRIRDLSDKSLCAFLASEDGSVCARDASGKIQFSGDYCSTDKQPGSCKDSVWLAATFAASAAKIFDGKGLVEGCSGATTNPADAGPADAGSDAPLPEDASTDAADGDG